MKIATAKKNVKDFNLEDVLNTATAVKESKSKSKVPALTVSAEIKTKATKIREVKEELNSLESMYEILSTELIETISPLRENLCKQGYVSSVRVPDAKGLSLGISWADKYSKIPAENEKALRSIAGDRFDEYFMTEMVITVKDISEEGLTEIIKSIGPERFSQFFAVEKTFKPNTRFTQKQFTAFNLDQRRQLSQAGVRQYKPSIKI